MNFSQLENKLNAKSKEYILGLQTRPIQCKKLTNTILSFLVSFLKSESQRLLLLEDTDPSDGARKLFEVLDKLQDQSILKLPKDYLEAQNQTILRWEDLSQILISSKVDPKFKNLLVCEFAQTFQWKYPDNVLISTIIKRLSFSLSRKVIFITSRKDLFSKNLENIKSCESCLCFNVLENKIMPVFEASATSLIERASCGDVCGVKELLERGVNVNATGLDGNTALHEAAAKGHKDVVSVLLENGADINIRGLNEKTALHYAAQNGDEDVVLTLLRYGAHHSFDGNSDTPLHLAAANGFEDIVLMFLENGVNVNIKRSRNRTALFCAAEKGHSDVVSTLLRNGANHGPSDFTHLHQAAMKGHAKVISVLIENDFDVNIKACNGWTALYYAVFYRHKEVVLVLLEKGADINVRNNEGKTALDLALAGNDQDIIKYLRHHRMEK